jgi:hypothetical protein
MTIATHTTIPTLSETSVSRAFTILLHRMSDLTRLESAAAEGRCPEAHEDRTDDLIRARGAVLAAAQDALETPAEHPLDGPLHRLATLAELQMTLHCPEERASLHAQVMENHDLFEIVGVSVMDRRIREMQRVFFKRYSALVEGPTIADVTPEAGHFEAREAIPA